MRTSRYSTVLKRHIERQHRVEDPKFNNGEMHARDNIANDGLQEFGDHRSFQLPMDYDPEPDEILDKEDVTEMVASSVARMKASSSITQSTVDHVISETSNLFSNVIGVLKVQTERFFQHKGIEDDDEKRTLLDLFDQLKNPFENLETARQQRKYFIHHDHFIKPREVPFAVAFYPRNNWNTGHVDQVVKSLTFQYIPLHALLKCVLESKGFMQTVLHSRGDGVMRDFCDGEFCQQHDFFSDSRNIKLLLYVDECEIANPLGSKAGLHKIGVIYCTIRNLPPKLCSSLSNCFLGALYNAGDAKTFGLNPILQPLVNDIRQLEQGGLYITTDVFEGTVFATIAQLAGDNGPKADIKIKVAKAVIEEFPMLKDEEGQGFVCEE
ncbi:hypothetical protein HOLleu_03331 [Holothuria leucospilota]|uniref:Uncharacterized protein n=1 Tax=Holothuria leucospilota TaxID=206669 RepID=A0A9Q1HHJ7_HOLLE|nr:hypothetical protein HOLleu_03331 [Holothuria leucospilota]